MIIHELHEDEEGGGGAEGPGEVAGLVGGEGGEGGSAEFEGDDDDVPVEVLVVDLPEFFELVELLGDIPFLVEDDVLLGDELDWVSLMGTEFFEDDVGVGPVYFVFDEVEVGLD